MFKPLLVLLVVFFFILPQFSWGQVQVWVRTYNGTSNLIDQSNAIAVGALCNVYVTGFSTNVGTNADYVTIKYLPNGTIAPTSWPAIYNNISTNLNDIASDIAVDNSGNVLVTGYSWNGLDWDYTTISYNSNGGVNWSAIYNGGSNDQATAIAVDNSGNVYVTGFSWNGSDYDYVTRSYTSSGVFRWTATYNFGFLDDDYATALALDNSGNVLVTGYSWNGFNFDYATMSYTSAFGVPNPLPWPVRYNRGFGDDKATAIAVDNSGNVYVTGYSWNGTDFDYATIGYLPSGAGILGWPQTYNQAPVGFDQANDIAVDGSGNVFVTGTSSNGSDLDYATIGYNPSGVTLLGWPQIYNGTGSGNDEATALAIDKSGNIYVTGYAFNGTDDFLTIKYTPGGAMWPGSPLSYNGTASSNDRAKDIALNCWGNAYVTGWSIGAGTGSDCATIKYIDVVFICGDANRDTRTTVSDVVYLVVYLFKGGLIPNPPQAADVNCDCKINISDVIYLVNYLFKG